MNIIFNTHLIFINCSGVNKHIRLGRLFFKKGWVTEKTPLFKKTSGRKSSYQTSTATNEYALFKNVKKSKKMKKSSKFFLSNTTLDPFLQTRYTWVVYPPGNQKTHSNEKNVTHSTYKRYFPVDTDCGQILGKKWPLQSSTTSCFHYDRTNIVVVIICLLFSGFSSFFLCYFTFWLFVDKELGENDIYEDKYFPFFLLEDNE